MNVYVREMASALAQQGTECIVYTRADAADLPREVVVEPGHRVVYLQAGPHQAVVDDIEARGGVDAVHAHYWLSGAVGHALKHRLEVPFIVTFHTLARVKGAGGDLEPGYREAAEAAQKVDAAVRAFRGCLELDPEQHWASWLLATALHRKAESDVVELERLCRRAIAWQEQHQQDACRQVYLLALTLKRKGDDGAARQAARDYLVKAGDGGDPRVLQLLLQIAEG